MTPERERRALAFIAWYRTTSRAFGRPPSARSDEVEAFLGWCDDHGVNPRWWASARLHYSARVIPVRALVHRTPKALRSFWAVYDEWLERKAATEAKAATDFAENVVYERFEGLAPLAELVKRQYVIEDQDPRQCFTVSYWGDGAPGGWHPESPICSSCPLSGECRGEREVRRQVPASPPVDGPSRPRPPGAARSSDR